MIFFLQKSCYSVVKDSRCCTLYRVSIDYSLFPSKSIHIFLIKPAHCGVSHISDHNRGRRDMSTLALSVWWCRPTGSAARAEHEGGAPVFISVFAGAFSWRARFSGVAPLTRHVTRAHSPRFLRGLAWLPSCSLTCVHMLKAGLRNK